MKKSNSFATFVAIALLLVMGCKVEPTIIEVESVSLSETTLTLEPGKTKKLTATVTPKNADDKTVKWSSSDNTVARVDSNGTIGAINTGRATITAQAGDRTAICIVSVKQQTVEVEKITLSNTTLTLEPNTTGKLTATVMPNNASDKTVTWSSSNRTVATVDNYGTVTAHTEGRAIITAYSGNITAACTVTVTETPINPEAVEVERITLDEETLSLTPNTMGYFTRRQLTATVEPYNADNTTITWSSSDETVATVDNYGYVTALIEGEAIITAKAGNKEATCRVIVKEKFILVESVTLDETMLTLMRGDTRWLTATVTPDNADNGSITWSSSDETVATVITMGNSCIITAMSNGTTTITAMTDERWATRTIATCMVTVNSIPIENVTLNATTLTIEPGKTRQLTATVTPDNADNKTVTWSSSDTSVATVDNYGWVTTYAEGEAIITAKAGNKEATCIITVKPILIAVENVTLDKTMLTLKSGDEEELQVTVEPYDADDRTVLWSSSEPSVASVSNDGTVTAVNTGTAIITAQAGDKTATCEVTVNPTPVESITLNTTTLTLLSGDYANVIATVEPFYASEVTWSSSDETIVTPISTNGMYNSVRAVKAGTATITAQAGGITATCEVTVNPRLVESVTLNETTLTLISGDYANVIATVTPSNADDTTVTWSSSDETVVTPISTNGTYNSVRAVKAGTAIITAQAGGKTATCEVTVNPRLVESVTLDETMLTLKCDNTQRLWAKVEPYNADDTTVKWSSSNEAVATVDKDGTVTAHAEGNASITAKAGGKTATCEVTVKSILIEVESVTLNKTTLTLTRGDDEKLQVTEEPDNADNRTVLWSSSNPSVAEVSEYGRVYALKAGTAIITAKAGGITATCTVTVNTKIPVNAITLNPTTLTIESGNTGKLTATVTPSNADDKTVTWLSSNTSVATVSDDGTVTALSKGTTTITATAGGITATCTVTVNTKIPVNNITLNPTTLTIESGNTGKLTATVTPSNADDKTVKWSSSNTSVATVNDYGTVTALSKGTATITATAGSKTATCTVTVKISVNNITLNPTTLTIESGNTGKLTATVTPSNADDKTVTWSSSNSSVATVSNDGTVTALSKGTATITATAGSKTATCTVTVKIPVNNITLNPTTLTIKSGNTGKLTATVAPSNADDKTVTWSSSNSSIATVSNDGTVTAVSKGTATITAKAGDKTATCAVTVNPKILVDNITLDETKISIEPNKTRELWAKITPSDADDRMVTWSSSDTSVATVNYYGIVTAVSEGTATITAKAGDKSVTCEVTVCVHSYSGGKCTVCGAKPYLKYGIIDDNGVLTEYSLYNPGLVVIPDGVTGIGKRAFYNNTLTNVTIPNSVTRIEDDAFYWCEKLTNVTIPDSVTNIGSSAFYRCTSLSSVTIGDSVTKIGSSAFYQCTSLSSVTIGDSVTSIGFQAFYDCASLKSITFPNSVTSIGNQAFCGCTYLTNVTIPGSVTNFGQYAFDECMRLTSVTILDGVTSIGLGAFQNCKNLTNVTIPSSVTSIETHAFYNCTNLETITYNGTKEEWSAIEKGYNWNYTTGDYTIICTDGELQKQNE